jgi:DNA-3-methyladenine glycosylase
LYNIPVPETAQLTREFFSQDAVKVARALLGKCLVNQTDGWRISGIIVETEAYRGTEDLGCHARAGLTARTQVMFGPPGHAYVYFTYGMHWMLNFVVEAEGYPAAVLIRSLVTVEGQEIVAARRKGQPTPSWTDGPAKICQALAIDGRLNGLDVCAEGSVLSVFSGMAIPDSRVTTGARVGLKNVPEPWKSIPWRFTTTLSPTLASEVS